jgi:2-dehydropantoate 2-reductase
MTPVFVPASGAIMDNAHMNTTARARHWHILGTGAMACLWGAYLSASGHHVTLIGRQPGARRDYHGIVLETAGGSMQQCVSLQAADDDSRIERLLVCTKAYDVLQALAGVSPRLDSRARVVLLQNGMGFHDEAAHRIAPARLFCAITTEGAHRLSPFHVQHAGTGITQIGAYGDIPRSAAQRLRGDLPLRFLKIRAVSRIETALWRKLAVSSAINALTAVHGCRNGELLDSPALHTEFAALCQEIASILHALGFDSLARSLVADASRVARATAANRSSMLQDVGSGQRTEIEFINGWLCRQAADVGVASPLNLALCDRIHALERACA